ncbi:MAG: hypothetical protein KKB50_15570 [Planctomycetes bacterium]|nr:hypothetical protein [Planctomycetota bacterium]
MRVALVTCVRLPEPDRDQAPLLAALRGAGVAAELLAWDDPRGDPAAFDVCTIRSTWNYYEDAAAFLAWIDKTAAATRLFNSAPVVRWNIHKRYLRELEGQGLPIIPTSWVARGAAPAFARILDERGWSDVVIKPAVSAASFRTRRFNAAQCDAGQAFLDELSRAGDVLVQRYMPAIEAEGERALVWIDGQFTHAVRKSPRFAEDDEHVSDALDISAAERAFGDRVLAAVDHNLLYARVDVIRDTRGELCLSELELMEPSLFLVQSPTALERLVTAILRHGGH